jgi:hypothetical protein
MRNRDNLTELRIANAKLHDHWKKRRIGLSM